MKIKGAKSRCRDRRQDRYKKEKREDEN